MLLDLDSDLGHGALWVGTDIVETTQGGGGEVRFVPVFFCPVASLARRADNAYARPMHAMPTTHFLHACNCA